jgi:hydrogenase maturation protease
MTAIVIGIGDEMAGDDGVGLAVARAVVARGLTAHACGDASLVLALAGSVRSFVLVDAVVGGGPPGTVIQLDPHALASGPTPLSSHGIGVAEAIALASVLYGEEAARRIAIVGIAIEPPIEPRRGLSDVVAAAVATAARLVAKLATRN